MVAEFDTTELTFNLREAEADLAEAEQQVRQAKAESLARDEEARLALLKAESELRIAELEARRNDMLAAIAARQNELAVESARDRLHQLQEDLASRKATADAGIAMQEAAVKKAQVKSEMARKMIDSHDAADAGRRLRVDPAEPQQRHSSPGAWSCRSFRSATPPGPAWRWRRFRISTAWR